MAKRPATQFYWGDWRRDTALRACSLESRGLWIDLLCVMHDGEPYGHLAVKGQALTDHEAAGVVGIPVARYRRLLAELEAKGVPSRTDDGMIYSRRMVRDEHIRTVRATSGKLGGNPILLDNQRAAKLDKQSGKQKPTPAVASASAKELPSNNNNGAARAEPAASWPQLHGKLPPTGLYRQQVMAFVASLPEAHAEGWCALLLQTLAGIGTPGGVAVTPDELLTTIATYTASRTGDHDTRYFAGCLRNVVKRRYAETPKASAAEPGTLRLPRLTDPDMQAAS
jgi:hypothetical protein